MTLSDKIRTAWSLAADDAGIDAAFADLFSTDYIRHSGADSMDRQGFVIVMRELLDAFPDLRIEILDAVEQDDRVAYRWESTGTHSDTYLGVLATNKPVVARGITISRFVDGRVVEEWASWDKVSVLHSLGILQLH